MTRSILVSFLGYVRIVIFRLLVYVRFGQVRLVRFCRYKLC
jgi:hypothetical protein